MMTPESRAFQAQAYADTVARDVAHRLFETFGQRIALSEENRICNEYRKRAKAKFLKLTAND